MTGLSQNRKLSSPFAVEGERDNASRGRLLAVLDEVLAAHARFQSWVGVPAAPPDARVTWLREPRFFVGLEPATLLHWPGVDGPRCERLGPGRLLFLPGGSWNVRDRETPCRFLGVVLRSGCVRFLLADDPGDGVPHPPVVWHHTHYPAPAVVSELLLRAVEASGGMRETLLTTVVHLLTQHLREDAVGARSAGEPLYEAIRNYVTEHVGDGLTRSRVATVFDRHPNYLSELFRRHGDETFHQFLTRMRLRYARDLLEHTSQPIKAVAAASGYERQSHFGRLFRKQYGMSPGAYRTNHAHG